MRKTSFFPRNGYVAILFHASTYTTYATVLFGENVARSTINIETKEKKRKRDGLAALRNLAASAYDSLSVR